MFSTLNKNVIKNSTSSIMLYFKRSTKWIVTGKLHLHMKYSNAFIFTLHKDFYKSLFWSTHL